MRIPLEMEEGRGLLHNQRALYGSVCSSSSRGWILPSVPYRLD
jgi:hypothetical protein